MKVVLLKDVPKVGKKYDIKDVADGFAFNSLIPRGLAEVATPKAIQRVELVKKQDAAERKVREDLLMKNLKDLENVTVEIKEKVNDKGHLFAAIHKPELISAIKTQTRLDMDETHIMLDKPIKEVGEHTIEVKVGEKNAKFKLNVVAA
jgi:large subunit ribosomal protein L9